MTRKERKLAKETETALLAPHFIDMSVARVAGLFKTRCGRWAKKEHVSVYIMGEDGCHECLRGVRAQDRVTAEMSLTDLAAGILRAKNEDRDP